MTIIATAPDSFNPLQHPALRSRRTKREGKRERRGVRSIQLARFAVKVTGSRSRRDAFEMRKENGRRKTTNGDRAASFLFYLEQKAVPSHKILFTTPTLLFYETNDCSIGHVKTKHSIANVTSETCEF